MLVQFLLFSAVGAIGTAVHFGLLIALVKGFASPPVAASAMGFAAGAVVNYWLNYTVTFRGRGQHSFAIPKFFIGALAGFGLNFMIMYLVTGWLHYLLSQILATGLVLVWNYVCSRCWTFKEARCAGQ